MDIEFTITPQRSSILAGEDASLKMTLTNRSTREITLPDPGKSADWPRLKWKHLGTRQETVSSRGTVAGARGADFLVPLPDAKTSIAPGKSVEVNVLLSQISLPLNAGEYELSGSIEFGEKDRAESGPLKLSVEPLSVSTAESFATQSGAPPNAILYTAETKEGIAVLLGGISSDGHEPPAISMGTRVGSTGAGFQSIVSVTSPEAKWPGFWLFSAGKGNLSGSYFLQWKDQFIMPGQSLGMEQARLVFPAFLDLEKGKDLKPVPALVAGITATGSKLTFFTKQVGETGEVKEGPTVDLEQGKYVWGRAEYFAESKARYIIAAERNEGVDVQIVSRHGSSALTSSNIGRGKGGHVASALCRSSEGIIDGCTVAREQGTAETLTLVLYLWSVDAEGGTQFKRSASVNLPKGIQAVRGIASAGKNGAVQVIFTGSDGAWYAFDQTGKCMKLNEKSLMGKNPNEICWQDGQIPYAIVSNRERGLQVLSIKGLFDSPLKN